MIVIKSRAELEKMRDAGKLAAEILIRTSELLKAGVTTLELNNFADRLTREAGAESAPLNYRGFPKSICTSVNNVVCHGIPKATEILRDSDIINIDITVKLRGYHGDTSRTYAIGQISDEAKNLMIAAEKAMWVGIEVVRPEARICDIGDAIDAFLTPLGYGIVRDLAGHGIGKSFHEDPSVPHYKNNGVRSRMKPGMTFTVEPMVNRGKYAVNFDRSDKWTVTTVDGSLSAQYEHTVAVTDHGYEILTLP
jgi:methionyl aminopeptidase